MAYARFPAADSHAGQAQPPRWSPRHWRGARLDGRGKFAALAYSYPDQRWPSKSSARTRAAPPDPYAEENQTHDQDDRADEQQEQQSFTTAPPIPSAIAAMTAARQRHLGISDLPNVIGADLLRIFVLPCCAGGSAARIPSGAEAGRAVARAQAQAMASDPRIPWRQHHAEHHGPALRWARPRSLRAVPAEA